MTSARRALIVALDDLGFEESLGLVKKLLPYADTFKVGLSLFSAFGPKIVESIKGLGAEVFLDLKLHDIPMQVNKSIWAIKNLEPRFVTIHSLGGPKMIEAAIDAALDSSTTVLAVSILTSLEDSDLQRLNIGVGVTGAVMALVEMAFFQHSGIRSLEFT